MSMHIIGKYGHGWSSFESLLANTVLLTLGCYKFMLYITAT